MKQLSKLSRIALIALFMVFFASLSGCKEEEMTNPVARDNGASLFEKFSAEENFWTEQQVENVKFDSPENAIVPLLFKEDGSLYSSKEFQEVLPMLMQGKKELKSYFTDIKTYQKIIGATAKRAKDFSEYALPIDEEVYIYDPYRTEEITREDYLIQLNKVYRSSEKINATSFQEGDIIVGRWTNGNPAGHCATVHRLAPGYYSSITDEVKKTTTFDAWSGSVAFSDQVGEKSMSTYWLSSYCASRSRMRTVTPLTTTQKSKIKIFCSNQDNKGYSLTTSLWADDKWYCSKLVYRSYYNAGIDLVPGTGYFLVPTEIKYSKKLYGMSF